MHNGGGGTGHGGGQGHGGQGHGGQGHGGHGAQHGHHHTHHGHLNGGIPANSPAESVNWNRAMQGMREKTWVQLLRHNKGRMMALSVIGLFFMMCLFVIDFANSRDASRHITSEHPWNEQAAAEASQAVPMQQSSADASAMTSESGIPSAFGVPRSTYESSSSSSYSNFQNAPPAVSNLRTFGARSHSPVATMPPPNSLMNPTTGRYRMVVNR